MVERLRERVESAMAELPGVKLELAAALDFVTGKLPRAADEAAAALERLHVKDVLLSYACLRQEPAALRLFDTEVLPRVLPVVQRIDQSPAFADEVLQRLRLALLMGVGDSKPKLEGYAGRASLVTWLRTVALSTALNLVTRERTPREENEEELHQLAAPGGDTELLFIKANHRADFKAVFAQAIAGLDAQARNVLRMRFADGLTLQEIGNVFRVHASTVLRWIDTSREQIVEKTRAGLAERLKLTPTEIDSMIDLLRSDLDISVRTFL
jgi:RNA polymerase sigma-70 factor, ECF subfamily